MFAFQKIVEVFDNLMKFKEVLKTIIIQQIFILFVNQSSRDFYKNYHKFLGFECYTLFHNILPSFMKISATVFQLKFLSHNKIVLIFFLIFQKFFSNYFKFLPILF